MLDTCGHVIGILCGVMFDRKWALIVSLCMLTGSATAFAWAGAVPIADRSWLSSSVLYDGYVGLKIFCAMCFVVIYQYTAELYPTTARATGLACCLAMGRIGSAS